MSLGDGSGRTESALAQPISHEICCADKFSALAGLFRADDEAAVSSVKTLVAPCVGAMTHDCVMVSSQLVANADRASKWLESQRDETSLTAECERLFGSECGGRIAPRVPACASTYLEGPTEAVRQDIHALYHDLGFPGEAGELHIPDCPCHISNELDFVAHCLRLGSSGLPGASEAAADFLSTHLFAWGIVFAAAVSAVAENPVFRFAGGALEGLLFCEASLAFDDWNGAS